MTQRPRRPDLDEAAPRTLTQAAHIALGLISLPIFGLGLLMAKRGSPVTPGRPGTPTTGTAISPKPPADQPEPATRRERDGPSQAEVEAALRKLTDATVPKAPPRPRTSKLKSKASPKARPKRPG